MEKTPAEQGATNPPQSGHDKEFNQLNPRHCKFMTGQAQLFGNTASRKSAFAKVGSRRWPCSCMQELRFEYGLVQWWRESGESRVLRDPGSRG